MLTFEPSEIAVGPPVQTPAGVRRLLAIRDPESGLTVAALLDPIQVAVTIRDLGGRPPDSPLAGGAA